MVCSFYVYAFHGMNSESVWYEVTIEVFLRFVCLHIVCVCVYILVCVYIYSCVYIYIYIYNVVSVLKYSRIRSHGVVRQIVH
jgi:hypothetical protein